MTVEIKDNKGNIYNIGLINNTMQNNVELTSENKIEIKTGVIEFAKALIGNTTCKFIANYKLKKEKLEREISNELKKIDTKKIVEPRMSVVGPTMESLKYTLDEEQIRKMYIKLLAGELNQDTHSKVLPAYIEIIKQLSKEDAMLLKSFKEMKKQQLSTCITRLEFNNKEGYVDLDTIIVDKPGHTIMPKKIVLENLERLNIIQLSSNIALPANNEIVKNAFSYYKSKMFVCDKSTNTNLTYTDGSLIITDFGWNFIDICCS